MAAAAASCSGGGDDGSRVLGRMMAAVELVLQGIGEDVEREGLRKTPLRVASAFQGALAGYQLSAKDIIAPALFSEAGAGGETGCGGGSGGIVVVNNIDLFALCESCLLPFKLRCHVVYVPCGQRVVGLSKFPRVAEIFAKRLQNPHKFADELVEALNESFGPLGVGVVVETWHLQWPAACTESPKVHARAEDGGLCPEELLGFGWVPVTVCAGKGQFENLQCMLWDEFLTILQLEGIDIEKAALDGTQRDAKERKSSCPFLVLDEQGVSSSPRNYSTSPEVNCNGSSGGSSAFPNTAAEAMALGVESLMLTMAVDWNKEELWCTAGRFMKWIFAATQGSRLSTASQRNGHDDHGSNCCRINGTVQNNGNGFSSNGYGSLSYWGPGPENDQGWKGNNVNGSLAVHSNGTGNSALSNGNGHLSDGILSNHHHYGHHAGSGSVSGHQRNSTNGLVRYGNGTTLNDANGTMSNRSSLSRTEVAAGADNFFEGLLCLELEISFASLCEHHLLPFLGVVHVGYSRVKGSRPIDRSLVLKIVAMYSRRLQAQERLTRQILEAVVSFPGLLGAIVVIEASHMCIMARGVEKSASSTSTVATFGKFSSDGAIRSAFLKRLPRKGAKRLLDN